MADIEILFYGHSCFKVSYEENSAVFDPYENNSVPGLKLPEGINASVVYCSHEHGDHNAKHLIHETDPDNDPFNAQFITVPHDDANGALRGMNRITILHANGCTLTHMGDIGRIPTAEEYEALKDTDVLMIPVGGHYTIDAEEAKKIIETIQPKLSILMHFRRGSAGYDVIADIESVRQVFPQLKEPDECSLRFNAADVPEGIITLQPAQ